MREWIDLFEAGSVAGQTLYHGTPTTSRAEAIARDGLKGQETQGKAHLAPVAGRVYMTPILRYAVIYALGGDMLGSELPERMIAESRYGYVFMIDGDTLGEVEPDEDSIGEWLSTNAVRNGREYIPKFQYTDPLFRLWYNIKNAFTPAQFSRAMDGMYAAWAQGGKRALKILSANDKALLIKQGTHIHHPSGVMPSQCWRIDKTRCPELSKDGSNFFNIAEKVL
jgi:hypothetical protein